MGNESLVEALMDRSVCGEFPLDDCQGSLLLRWPKLPSWAESLVRRANELMQLENGWDGQGALKLEVCRAYASLDVLTRTTSADAPEPSLVPTVNRGLQIEWHTCGIDLEFEVRPWGLCVYGEDLTGALPDLDEEGTPEAFPYLRTWIQHLTTRKNPQLTMWAVPLVMPMTPQLRMTTQFSGSW